MIYDLELINNIEKLFRKFDKMVILHVINEEYCIKWDKTVKNIIQSIYNKKIRYYYYQQYKLRNNFITYQLI